MHRVLPLLLVCGFTFVPAADAQPKKEKGKYDPPASLQPSAEVLQQIQEKTAQLAAKIGELRKDPKHHELLPDVEIYLRGAENIIRFKEFFHKDSGKWTLDALERGLVRAEQLAKGETPWTKLATRNVLRAYRSQIDGTAQPYGVTYPLEYGRDPKRTWRVDVVLHGRNSNLTEVAFLQTHNGARKVPADQDWVQIDIFGRGNNAYRWAGESDVNAVYILFQGSEYRENRFLLSEERWVLRGFSMGGAGTWHLGLHNPSRYCVMGPGAGFTTTHGYAAGLPNPLIDHQERCLRIYDAVDYVENARMIPIVAYSGGTDPQKLAADNIENRLKELKIDTMTHLVAPGLGHKFPDEWFKKANVLWSEHATKGRAVYPKQISFVTYTLKYPRCDWITVTGLEKHYEKAMVNAEQTAKGYRITTTNVRSLRVDLPFLSAEGKTYSVVMNGQEIEAESKFQSPAYQFRSPSFHLIHKAGKWNTARELEAPITKVGGLQGPIDDAFASGFTCVIGSGETFHPSTQKFVDAKLKAFEYDWAKHWRGKLPTIGDYAVTPNEINDKHLILFGDPQSNLTLAQMMPKLPLKWTKDEIEFAGQKFKTSEHVPVLIFSNPLNPRKYVVLNTGHTFPSEDYTKTNALLFPRLGDYAILRLTPNGHEVAVAGLFDEFWRVEKK